MNKNNWLTTNLSSRSKSNLCDFEVYFNPYIINTNTSFQSNSIRVAKELVSKYDNLYLSFSGGSDSEFVLKTFIENKLPITPVIVRTNYNLSESNQAEKYCISHNIKYEIISFSDYDFIDKLKSNTTDKGLFSIMGGVVLLVCDYINQVNGNLLTGFGDPFITIPGQQPSLSIFNSLYFPEWDNYLDLYDSRHPSAFLYYDLELFYSLIKNISKRKPMQKAKCEIYNIPFRPKEFYSDLFYLHFKENKCDVLHECKITITEFSKKIII